MERVEFYGRVVAAGEGTATSPFLLETMEGTQSYEPVNLPASLQEEGLRVRVVGKVRTDLSSRRPSPRIELITIARV